MTSLLAAFSKFPRISQNIEVVFANLPDEIRADFLSDTGFRMSLDDCEPGRGRTVMLAEPGKSGASRAVVLKPRLENCSNAFACYIIAHELAHAHLLNGGWGEITCREAAADALASSWGFNKVPWE